MVQERKILAMEYAVIALLWSLVIISPLLFRDDIDNNWRAIHIMWAECITVGIVFIINRSILSPLLFFTKRYISYIVSLIMLFLLLSIFILYFDGVNKIILLFFNEPSSIEPIEKIGSNLPHHMSPRSMMPPAPGQRPMSVRSAPTVIPPAITLLIASIIVVALDIGFSIAVKWVISEQKQTEINRERVSVQLSNLQSQVSPHFFMNTLNNIHALVDIDSTRAKQTIIELSELMDYLLYESSNKERVSLQRELEFIGSYINLMRLRYPKRVVISFAYDENIPNIKIPPLLFLNFIENAFKYGVDYAKESFIKINFFVSSEEIKMITINSNHASIENGQNNKCHGIGISNSRKRLKLLYEDRYTLKLEDKEGVYYVTLKIPIE